MAHIPCPDCEYGKVEMEVRRSHSGDFITAMDTCPTCKGACEVEIERNPITEIEIITASYDRKQWVNIARKDDMRTYYRSMASLARLEKVLTDMVNEGQLDMVYEGMSRGVVRFFPSELPY